MSWGGKSRLQGTSAGWWSVVGRGLDIVLVDTEEVNCMAHADRSRAVLALVMQG